MRSFLFVPGDSERKLDKALASEADALLIDLEDSVAPAQKPAARETVVRFFEQLGDRGALPPLYVRINDLTSGFAEDDLDLVVPLGPAGILLPKARDGGDVRIVADLIDDRERRAGLMPGSLGLLVLATETPRAVLRMASFEACSRRLTGLTWGGEDLATAIGALANRDETDGFTPPLQLARNLCLLAAAAAGVPAIDTVYTDFRNSEGLEVEARLAARDGFTGKMAIHPGQVSIINRVFTPSERDVAEARSITAAFVASPQAGVVSVDGRMIDRPHLVKAQRTLERARLAGSRSSQAGRPSENTESTTV